MSKDGSYCEEYKIYGFRTRIDKSKTAKIRRPLGSSTINSATSPYFSAATTSTNQSPVIDQHSLHVCSLLEHEVDEYGYKLPESDTKDQVLSKYAYLFGLKPVSSCRNANNSSNNNIDSGNNAKSNSCNSPGKPFISTASPPPTGCNNSGACNCNNTADKTEAEEERAKFGQ